MQFTDWFEDYAQKRQMEIWDALDKRTRGEIERTKVIREDI